MATRPAQLSSESTAMATPLLRQHRLSITRPRREILQYLLNHHGPFSAEEIHQLIPPKTCDLATVYRCMNQFEKSGLVQKCYMGDEIFRYEYKGEHHHHHHIICRVCKKIESMKYCFMTEIEKMLSDLGHKDVDHSLEFYGICPRCQNQKH